MSDKLPEVFFGWPSNPPLRAETVANGAQQLDHIKAISAVPWTSLQISGQFVIDTILAAIDEAQVSAFDVTDLNQNVMFELGYSIGKKKNIWLLRDDSEKAAKRRWTRIKILTTVGYSPFTNSQDIVDEFWKQAPHRQAATIFDSAIRDYLQPAGPPAIFYLPSLYDTDAGRRLSRRIQSEKGFRIITADPSEAAVQSLAWYAQGVYSAGIVIAHFCAPEREGSEVHNARCALIAGLAQGMGKRVLMLAEDNYTSPIDYRDLLYVYPTSRACFYHADDWLKSQTAELNEQLASDSRTQGTTTLAVELKSLRIGDHVAENEADELLNYFVETSGYTQVLERNTTVFIGRKGTGKTANLIRAAEELRADKRNLVCVIKPYSYELESVLSLMTLYQERSDQSYLIESLWKFLIYSEIANAAFTELEEKAARPTPGSPEHEFVEFMNGAGAICRDEFAVRLETAVAGLLQVDTSGKDLSERRKTIAEALHRGLIQDLRAHLGRVLSGRNRVAVLVDNLDKAWHRGADVDKLAGFILSLLSIVGRITDEFARSDRWREKVTVTLAVFLRSDIYTQVIKSAREPDKIPLSRLDWDNDLLLRVIEERYVAAHGQDARPEDIWTKYFCSKVQGIATKDYILSRILPRPRDIIYFCSAAIAAAVNRRHAVVEEVDVSAAEIQYSQFALEALHVENGISISDLDNILYGFAGSQSRLTQEDVKNCITQSGAPEENVTEFIDHLRRLSFLGIQTGDNNFEYIFDMRSAPVTEALARRREEEGKPVEYEIHPAFRAYLEIAEPK